MKSFAPFIETSPRPISSGHRPRLLLPLLIGAGLALRASEVAPDEVVQLPPVTVIATALASPGRLEIDPRAPAQPIPAQDGADLLRAAPGINVIRKGGIDGDPVLRGMA